MTLKKLVIFYVIAMTLQLTLINLFALGGITPHLVLCLTVAIVFIYDSGYRCIIFALPSMLLLDMCNAEYAGIGTTALFVTCILVIFFRRELNVEQWAPLIVTGILGTVVYHLVYWGMLKIMAVPVEFLYLLKYIGFYCLYNTGILAILFIFMSRHKKKRDVRRYDE